MFPHRINKMPLVYGTLRRLLWPIALSGRCLLVWGSCDQQCWSLKAHAFLNPAVLLSSAPVTCLPACHVVVTQAAVQPRRSAHQAALLSYKYIHQVGRQTLSRPTLAPCGTGAGAAAQAHPGHLPAPAVQHRRHEAPQHRVPPRSGGTAPLSSLPQRFSVHGCCHCTHVTLELQSAWTQGVHCFCPSASFDTHASLQQEGQGP